jgi:hypothetical protein
LISRDANENSPTDAKPVLVALSSVIDAANNALVAHQVRQAGAAPDVQIIEPDKLWLVKGEYVVSDETTGRFESLVRMFESGRIEAINLMLNNEMVMDKPLSALTQPTALPTSNDKVSIVEEPGRRPPLEPEQKRPSMRTWMSSDGKFSTEVEFAGSISGKVRLRRADGSVITVDEEKLSNADREWIKKRSEK